MIRRIYVTVVLIMIAVAGYCQVNIQVNAPRVVAVGEPFRIEFVVDQIPENFTPPDFAAFNLIAGPQISQGQEYVNDNGVVSTRELYIYTFVLAAQKEGTSNIGPATAVVKGKNHTSRPVPVEVVSGAGGRTQPGTGTQGQSGQSGQQGATVAADDILLRLVVSKTNVYRGEPLRVSVKLYYRVPIAGIEGIRYPSFNNFWTQELNLGQQQPQRENYNNKVYETQILRDYLIFPQRSGTLEIEPMEMDVVARIVSQRQSRSIFDDIFGGGPSVQDVRRKVSSPGLKITVNDLPAGAPASFSGAVGRYNMEGTISSDKISANSAGTIRLMISGNGNFPLLETPNITLPGGFEQYDVNISDNYRISPTGIAGSKEYEYPFIARAEGEYVIPPIEFSYFDLEQKRYRTLTVPQFRIEVDRDSTGGASAGIVSGITKEDLKILGKDIRFIRVGEPDLRRTGTLLMWSGTYWIILLLLAAVFAVSVIWLRKMIRERRNVALVRNKTANKIAQRRLKAAKRYLAENKESEFYQEMLRALWGYVSDKLNIPLAHLSKDNIREELQRYEVSEEDINQFLLVISESEYAQYAPGAVTPMSNMYQIALDLIGRFESKIRK